MKTRSLALLSIAALLLVASMPLASMAQASHDELAFVAADPATVVYVTKTGEKYHRGTCRYLSKSKIKTTLGEAKRRGYTACKVCKPPV